MNPDTPPLGRAMGCSELDQQPWLVLNSSCEASGLQSVLAVATVTHGDDPTVSDR